MAKRTYTSEALLSNYRRTLIALKGLAPYAGPAGERCFICKGVATSPTSCARCYWIKEAAATLADLGKDLEA